MSSSWKNTETLKTRKTSVRRKKLSVGKQNNVNRAPSTLHVGIENTLKDKSTLGEVCYFSLFAFYWIDNQTDLPLVFTDTYY